MVESSHQSVDITNDLGASMPENQAKKKRKAPSIRKVTDYLVYVEEVLGIGQYGKVCKAQKQEDAKAKLDKILACKIIDIVSISQEDMECIEKEVRLHNLIQSIHSVRLY